MKSLENNGSAETVYEGGEKLPYLPHLTLTTAKIDLLLVSARAVASSSSLVLKSSKAFLSFPESSGQLKLYILSEGWEKGA